MKNLAIRVDQIGKQYKIGQREPYKSLRDSLAKTSLSLFRHTANVVRGRAAREVNQTRGNFIWALRDISFDVERGEVVGIIGPNGAGKSTLLKILSRITSPTEGRVEIFGSVGSLLEVGTGFNPELTGRENIYLNGAILGMKRFEIVNKFDEIVDFSGVEKFLETPVKRYSSGMYVRLAFAVAAHLNPGILLVDEVLAVGDAAFQQKCLGKMDSVARSGRTVLFVSHNMGAVRDLCSRGILLKGGKVQKISDVESVIQEYMHNTEVLEFMGEFDLAEHEDRSGSGRVRIEKFSAQISDSRGTLPHTGSDTDFIIDYIAQENQPLYKLAAGIKVIDAYGNSIFGCTTSMNYSDFHQVPPKGKLICRVKNLPLIPGQYRVDIFLKDEHGLVDMVTGAAGFPVIDSGNNIVPYMPSRRWGNIVVSQEWDLLPGEVEV